MIQMFLNHNSICYDDWFENLCILGYAYIQMNDKSLITKWLEQASQ